MQSGAVRYCETAARLEERPAGVRAHAEGRQGEQAQHDGAEGRQEHSCRLRASRRGDLHTQFTSLRLSAKRSRRS